LPNVGPYIYDVSISGFTRSSIYIYDISSLRVKATGSRSVTNISDVQHILQAAVYHTPLKLADRSDTHTHKNIHWWYGQK